MNEFNKKLLNDFPELFPRIDDIPVLPECGISVYKKWEDVVYNLFSAISSYQEQTHYEHSLNIKDRIIEWVWKNTFLRIHNFLFSTFNPYKTLIDSKEKAYIISLEIEVEAKKLRFYELKTKIRNISQRVLSKSRAFKINMRTRKVREIPPFCIDQIKDKFGFLTIYYSGGDDYVKGLVSFASKIAPKK